MSPVGISNFGERKMCILGYPPEIQQLVDAFDPYRKDILSKNLSAVPSEALAAYNKFKSWTWEQDQ